MAAEATEVTVVGAGPAGLMLATELALAGVAPTVLESLPGRGAESRALNLHPRTAEVLDSRGLLDELREYEIVLGTPAHSFFGALPVPLDCAPWRTRFPHQTGVVQTRVEDRLERRLVELGGSVRREHVVTGVRQDDEHVTADVLTPDGESSVRTRYLVACDGGRSTVRRSLGLAFPGSDGRQLFVAADLRLGRPPETWYDDLDAGRRRFLRLLPGNSLAGVAPVPGGRLMFSLRGLEAGVHRLSFSGPALRDTDRAAPVTEAEIRTAIEDACGIDVELKEVLWASRFTDACRQVEQYRVGRVLLAGDAAHIIVPLGGQGMNLGLLDAFNLGWKLAAVVKGTAPAGLLDTYHDERHPVAADLLREARAQFLLMDDGLDVAALREVVAGLLRVPETNRHLAGIVSGLGTRHPVSDQDDGVTGYRMPDLDLVGPAGPTRVHELLCAGHGVLLDLGDDPAVTEVVRPWPDRVVGIAAVPTEPFAAQRVLIRPDGHVCWAGDAADEAGQLAALHRWFGQAEPAKETTRRG